MDRYKVVKEDALNAYILDNDENYIVVLCSTKKPDLGFDRLETLVTQANEYIKLTTVKIEDLKVFEFDCGESDWVIARSEKEATDYYATIIDDIEEYDITEIDDWHNHKIRAEEDKKQPDGTYWKTQTMLEIAKEIYVNGYTGPEIIASTCY